MVYSHIYFFSSKLFAFLRFFKVRIQIVSPIINIPSSNIRAKIKFLYKPRPIVCESSKRSDSRR